MTSRPPIHLSTRSHTLLALRSSLFAPPPEVTLPLFLGRIGRQSLFCSSFSGWKGAAVIGCSRRHTPKRSFCGAANNGPTSSSSNQNGIHTRCCVYSSTSSTPKKKQSKKCIMGTSPAHLKFRLASPLTRLVPTCLVLPPKCLNMAGCFDSAKPGSSTSPRR